VTIGREWVKKNSDKMISKVCVELEAWQKELVKRLPFYNNFNH